MHSPKKEFYFCFFLNRLQLFNGIEDLLDPFTHFRIDILKSNSDPNTDTRTLAASREITSTSNEHAEVTINELLSFRLADPQEGC